MSVSRLLSSGGANDFNVAISDTYTVVTFDKEYSPGAYTIVSALNDSSYDIYAYASDGSSAGYTKSPSLTATKGFLKLVIIGGTGNDLLSFTYKKTYTSTNETAEVTAGPVATSVSPSNVPNINDTFVLTGRNFATDVEVYFSSGLYTSTLAKSIVRSSATSLIVTRPDNLPASSGPYTITVVNPGITNPTGTNSHILSNSISAGTNPAWSTSATLIPYTVGFAYNVTLLATDTENSDIDYTVMSGTLPTGITLDNETGVLSGTPTAVVAEGTTAVVTVRATDAGGNYLDRAFTFTSNDAPVWSTTAGALLNYNTTASYSNQLVATGGTVATSLTYTIQSGALPTGMTLSSSGLISGTSTATSTASFTVRVMDSANAYTDRAFTLKPGFSATGGDVVGTYGGYRYHKFNTSGTLNVTSAFGTCELIVVGGGGSGNSGSSSGPGGGAGALYWNTAFTMPSGATSYSITIGAGGPAQPASLSVADSDTQYRGGTTTAFGITAIGGGSGGAASTAINVGAFGNLNPSYSNDGGSGGGTYNGNVITATGLGYGRTAVSGVANFYGNNSGAGNSSGGGGGGGAGGTGTAGGAAIPGDGGAGLGFNWTGTTEYLAAGGGGGSSATAGYGSGNGGGSGGSGVGGFGGGATNNATNPVANTGSGGGGSGSGTPTAGAAGTVWVRYAI